MDTRSLFIFSSYIKGWAESATFVRFRAIQWKRKPFYRFLQVTTKTIRKKADIKVSQRYKNDKSTLLKRLLTLMTRAFPRSVIIYRQNNL